MPCSSPEALITIQVEEHVSTFSRGRGMTAQGCAEANQLHTLQINIFSGITLMTF